MSNPLNKREHVWFDSVSYWIGESVEKSIEYADEVLAAFDKRFPSEQPVDDEQIRRIAAVTLKGDDIIQVYTGDAEKPEWVNIKAIFVEVGMMVRKDDMAPIVISTKTPQRNGNILITGDYNC